MESIVLVKRWFDDVNGNTYHSVQFRYRGETYHSGRKYGYGTQYEQTFSDMEIKYCAKATLEEKAERLLLFSEPRYIVVDNCSKEELDKNAFVGTKTIYLSEVN